ncbi:MAG: hypothetical protein FWH11_09045 [Micrococcales bacterium]|nr:hypothetical protein [Micrococcales bacterium]
MSLPPEDFRVRADALGAWLASTEGRIPNRRSADEYEQGLACWRHQRIHELHDGILSPGREKYLDAVAPGWRPLPRGADVWRSRAEQLGAWLASAEGCKPNRGSADAHERRLADWRYAQLALLRAGTLLPEREAYLDAVAEGWRQGSVDKFRIRAEELGRWMRAAGRVPNRRSTDAHERELGVWRNNLRLRLRTGKLSPEREACLDALAPGWRSVRRRGPEEFRAKAAELARWMRSTGRAPDARSVDGQERALAAWRANRITQLRAGKLSPEREACLDAVVPDWRPKPRGGPEEFRAKADRLARWMDSTGRVPSRRSEDAHELRLARWVLSQSNRLRAGTLPSEFEAYLDQVAPGWRPRPRVRAAAGAGAPARPARRETGMAAFRTRAAELGRWMGSTGEAPHVRSDDRHERALAGWRYEQTGSLRAGKLPPEREACLDALAPGWRTVRRDSPDAFRAKAAELGRWMGSTGRIPHVPGDDRHERLLAGWRFAQTAYLRAGKLSPEREACLDALAPGWRPTLGRPEAFRARAEELGRWIRSNGGLPPSRKGAPHGRALGSWRRRQVERLGSGTLPPEHERYLDQVAPGWRPRFRKAVEFPARARALGRWMVWSDGRVPSQLSYDLDERRLNRWRRRWLLQLRTGTLPSEHERYLDEVAPGWRPRARSGVDEFPARAVALGRWLVAADGRLPSGRSDDLHERRLNRWRRGWLFHLRNGTLSPEHERYLDQVAPGWRPRYRTEETPGA